MPIQEFHLTDDGPKPCTAESEKSCSVRRSGGRLTQHFQDKDEAQKAWDTERQNASGDTRMMKGGSARRVFTSSGATFDRAPVMNPLNGDDAVREELDGYPEGDAMTLHPHFEKGYVTCHVNPVEVEKYRDLLRTVVGDEKYDQMAEMIAQRPSGDGVHVTAISPKEVRELGKKGVKVAEAASRFGAASVTPRGLGCKTEGDMETWFVVCESDDLNRFRHQLGLGDHQFHITLGYTHKDLFTPGGKGLASLLYVG